MVQVPGAEMATGRWEERGVDIIFPIPVDLVNANILIVPSISVPVVTKMTRVILGTEKTLPNPSCNTRGVGISWRTTLVLAPKCGWGRHVDRYIKIDRLSGR